MFIIATEGKETEPQYFQMFKTNLQTQYLNEVARREVLIRILETRKGDSSPKQVLDRAIGWVKKNPIKDDDEIWLVIDHDGRPEYLLDGLHTSCSNCGVHLAVSNPQFEYWLLLHFEDGKKIKNRDDCINRLRQHMPSYDKVNFNVDKLKPGIREAIRRAKEKDADQCSWPTCNGTTVYRLVEKIL
jgi:hypothetical protein